MSLNLDVEDDDKNTRFFTPDMREGGDQPVQGAVSDSQDEDAESDLGDQKCLTLRLLQRCLPWFKNKSVWEPSQGDLFKNETVEEVKYPAILTFLEKPFCEFIVVFSSLFSVLLLTFSEGFLLENRIVWGIIHLNNFIYTFCVFGWWLEILVQSKYAKTKQGFTTTDTVFSIISVLPIDIIVLVIYILNDNESDSTNPVTNYLTMSRLHYLFRLRNVFRLFAKWEDQLAFGDFKMFLFRVSLYWIFFIHVIACCWHRMACNPFTWSHFQMTSAQATADVCMNGSWVTKLLNDKDQFNQDSPLLRHDNKRWHILVEHYLVCLYWAVVTCFRLGATDIRADLRADKEVAFVCGTNILAWIFVIAYVSGSLTSILVERDTEKENFLTRRFAIERFLDFSYVTRDIRSNVNKFYDYLWARSRGIHNWDLVDQLPITMKAEIYYDVNKFVLDQLPLFMNMDAAFLMNLSVHMKHCFFLRGEVLQRKGQNGKAMFYLINGRLDILHDDEESVIAEVRSGSAIGELFVLQSYPVVATVRCGTECDVMMLHKSDCRKVLNMYPEYKSTLQKRVDSRLEQSGLLLALSEKHNEYGKALHTLREISNQEDYTKMARESYFHSSFEAITGVLEPPSYEMPMENKDLDDFDGLDLDSDTRMKLKRSSPPSSSKKMTAKDALAALCLAIEADVARATSLAKDLNIARPPLFVKAPNEARAASDSADTRSSSSERFTPFNVTLLPKLWGTISVKSGSWKIWKFFVLLCICLVVFYYPYHLGFRNHAERKLIYVLHVCDVIFLIDFILDTMQPVVLPQKTLESTKEILGYHLKTWYFYIRIFSFLPLEYVVGPMAGLTVNDDWFYFLKLNRIILYYEVLKFFSLFEADTRVAPEIVFIVRFALRLFFFIHFFAIGFEIVLKFVATRCPDGDCIPVLDFQDDRFYEFVYYWATEVLTATGYGDFPLRDDWEIALTVTGLICGICMIIFLNARLAAMMANRERRRIWFKQMYYSVMSFMKERRFSVSLFDRVKQYYRLQWNSHEGVLIVNNNKSAIWDAPKTLMDSVSYAQAQIYMTRIPIFMYCSEDIIMEMCAALQHYIVPPDEILLYPSDQTRELFIIVKGFCKVFSNGKLIGKLGEGNYFGLKGLIFGTNKDYLIQTVNFCQFFCLEFSSFFEIAKKYPKFLDDYKLLRGESTLPNGMEIKLSPDEWEYFKFEMEEEQDKEISEESSVTQTQDGVFTSSGTSNAKTESLVPSTLESTAPSSQKPTDVQVHVVRKPKGNPFQKIFVDAILPHGKFLRIWTIIRVISAFLIGNFVLIQLAFSVDTQVAFVTVLLFDILAWIDIFICFRVGFFGPGGRLIVNFKETAVNYLRNSFALDVLGCIPLDLFFIMCSPGIVVFGDKRNVTYNNMYRVVCILRLTRILQCYRLFVSGRLLAKTIFRSLSVIILLQVIPLMGLFLNTMTCLAVVAVCGTSLNGEPIHCSRDAWIVNGVLYNGSRFSKDTVMEDPVTSYIIGLYWLIISAMCVGFGDIDVIRSATNRKIAITVIFIGVVITGFLVSKLTACQVGEDSRRISIREKTKVMFKYLEQFSVPRDLRRRAQEYYFSAWDKTRGIFPKDLFAALHPSLKSDVMKTLYHQRLKLSPVFVMLDDPGIRILSSILEEMFYPEGEFVFEYGDLNGDVFFIAKGLIATYTERGDIMSYVGTGSIIGEISCLFDVQRQYTAVAATDCEIYLFRRDDFLDFLQFYPSMKTTIEEGCMQHYKATMDAAAKSTGFNDILVYDDLNEKPEDLEEQLIDLEQSAGIPVHNRPKAASKDKTDDDNHSRKSDHSRSSSAILDVMKSHHSLAVVEMDLGSAKEVTSGEAEKEDPDFISDPLRPPVSSSEYERRNRRFTKAEKKKSWVSYLISFGKVPRDEMGFLHIVQERYKCSFFNFTFHPLSPICTLFAFFLFVTSVSCGLTAYEIAFHTPHEMVSLLSLRICVEVFFVARFLGNFQQGYYDEFGVIVTEKRKILRRYFCRPTGFILDVITTFPFYIISYGFGGLRNAEVAADIRGLQLFRVFLFARYLKETETELRMKLSRVKIVKVTILLVFIFHFCACAWYLVACDGMTCKKGSWMNLLLKSLIEKRKIIDESDIPIGSRYLLSLYYVTSAITFTGLSDITPRTQVELCCTIAMIFTTVFVIGFLVGEMTQCLASQVKSKIHFRHKLQVMEHQFTSLGLSNSKLTSARKYFRLVWLRCNGNPLTDILSELPYSLRADITMKIYGFNIKNSRILGRLDDTIVRQLSARMKHEIFMPGAHIIRAGTVCSSIYFIKKGEVVILDEKGSMELCVDVLYENECFGEVKGLLSVKEQFQFSYVAKLETEVGVLQSSDVDDVVSRHPGLLEDINVRAAKMKQQRIRKEEERQQHATDDSTIQVDSISAADLRAGAGVPAARSGPGISRLSAIFGKGYTTSSKN